MKKKNKTHSFARRLTRWIAFTQLIVMGLASWLIYKTAKNLVMMEEIDLYNSYLWTSNANVGRVLSDVSVGATNRVDEIEANLANPDKMTDIMKEVVAQNPRIRSCGIRFVADYYPQKGRWYCPYAIRGADGQIESRNIGSARHDYLKAEWFTTALEADSSYWSNPFFDGTDSISPLVSYLLPIHDKRGKTVAILGADLLLDWFKGKMVSEVTQNGSTYNVYIDSDSDVGLSSSDSTTINFRDKKWRLTSTNFIIDSRGTYLAHPDNDHVIKKNYFELAKATPDTIDDYVGHQMVAGEKGSYYDDKGFPKSFKFFDMDGMSAYMFFQPIENTNWSIASAVPSLMVDTISIGAGVVMLILIALGLFVVRFVGRRIIRRATKSLDLLVESANEVAKGNFNTPLPRIKHNDEIRLLRDSFAGMQLSLTKYVDELKTTTATKASMEKELKVAHDIQMSMLPKTFPPYPERDDIDIYGILNPARDVGGDLFDFFIRSEKLFFCIGDVSGKGVPASLVMAVTRSLFRNISSHLSEPDLIVKALNDALADGNETNMFVTLYLGVLDLQTGLLRYCNAGHNSPLIMGRDISSMPCHPNLPLGVMTGMDFSCQEMQLQPETTIFLYTDGLNEAEDATHALFGDHRIVGVAETLLVEGNRQPKVVVGSMEKAVRTFVGEAVQSDDLTMLAIKWMKNERK
jgi:sigma-B regulation protein RsbU (phosphoserine phosphatase)